MSQVENRDPQEIDGNHVVAVMADLRRVMQTRIDSGLVPIDGWWVTFSEASEKILSSSKQSRVHAIELVLLYGFNTFASLLIIVLVRALCY